MIVVVVVVVNFTKHQNCLPILMLLYIMLYIVLAYLMLYIVLAYLMLFAALSNAVCIMLLFANDFCNCFLFSCFVLVY